MNRTHAAQLRRLNNDRRQLGYLAATKYDALRSAPGALTPDLERRLDALLRWLVTLRREGPLGAQR